MAIHTPSLSKWDPDVRAQAVEVDAEFPRKDWTSTYPGHGEHSAVGAYAIDYMVANKATGDAIVAYLIKHRKRLGIRYLIWYRRIINWGRDGDGAKWKTYFNANAKNANGTPNPSKQHTNHVHMSCEVNAKYKALGPVKPKPQIDLSNLLAAWGRDVFSPEVKVLQDALNDWRPSLNLDEDGYPGPKTQDALDTFRAWKYGVPKTHSDASGKPGKESLTALGFEVKA